MAVSTKLQVRANFSRHLNLALAVLALDLEVCSEWLYTGQGPMRPTPQNSVGARIDAMDPSDTQGLAILSAARFIISESSTSSEAGKDPPPAPRHSKRQS